MSWLVAPSGREPTRGSEMSRHTLRLLEGMGAPVGKDRPAAPKTRLDEEIVEDADSRHEQFTDERERWQDDRPADRA